VIEAKLLGSKFHAFGVYRVGIIKDNIAQIQKAAQKSSFEMNQSTANRAYWISSGIGRG
jgi:hypothetical protein